MFRVFQAALTVLMVITFASTSVIAKATVCESTGPRCKTTDQCSTLADGMYQWCGGCEKNVRCQAGVGELFDYYNPSYTQWDDNSKNFEAYSTTCIECHYPCPPGPYQPECSLTGMGCVADLCPMGANGNIQYCKNCTHYVQCTYGSEYRLVACPEGLYYDESVRTCVPQSKTCVHCYNPSNCHAQETTTAGVMWTTTAGMMTTAASAATTTHASPSSECTCTCTCGTKCN